MIIIIKLNSNKMLNLNKAYILCSCALSRISLLLLKYMLKKKIKIFLSMKISMKVKKNRYYLFFKIIIFQKNYNVLITSNEVKNLK